MRHEPTEPCASLVCVENDAGVRKLYPLGHVVLVPSCTVSCSIPPCPLHFGWCGAASGRSRAGSSRARFICPGCKKHERIECQEGQLTHCSRDLFTFPLLLSGVGSGWHLAAHFGEQERPERPATL